MKHSCFRIVVLLSALFADSATVAQIPAHRGNDQALRGGPFRKSLPASRLPYLQFRSNLRVTTSPTMRTPGISQHLPAGTNKPMDAAQMTFLDKTFGTNGSTRSFISGGNSTYDFGHSIAIQADGKIVAGGYSHDGSGYGFAVARYDSTGSVDSTFGTNGSTRNFISGGNGSDDDLYSIAIQADGKIVGGGYSYDGSVYGFALARYKGDGSLDSAFGTNGTTRSFISGGNCTYDGANALAIQTDGKIVAGGYSYDGSGYGFAVARYDSTGSVDSTFGINGSTRNFISGGNGSDDELYSIAMQADEKIVAGGLSYDGSTYGFALARYKSDGSIDSTFGTNGSTRNYISGGNSTYDFGYSIVIQPDGKIVAGGYSYDGSGYGFAVARYKSDGSLDNTFGTNGSTRNFISGGTNSNDAANCVALQADGKIVAGGYSEDGSTCGFALARYKSDGSLDDTFGTNGSTRNFIAGGNSTYDLAYSVVVQADGKIVAGGSSSDGSRYGFALARYIVYPVGISTLSSVLVSANSATLRGVVNAAGVTTSVRFLLGSASGVYTDSSESPHTLSTNAGIPISDLFSGLSPGTEYFFAVSTNSASGYFVGEERSFMTISPAGGNALEFDGADDFVRVPYDAALNPSGDFTVELWARADAWTGSFYSPLTSRSSFAGYDFYQGDDAHWQFWFGPAEGGMWKTIIGDTVLIGQWTHLAAVYSGSTFTFYVNGDSAGSDNSGLTPNTANPFYIGCGDNGGPWFHFNGAVSEVRFWNVARSQSDIQSAIHITLGGGESGLVAYWQLTESNPMTTAYECIGGYNGALTNFTFSGDGWVPATGLVLPVQAADFRALPDIGSVRLSWETHSEVNNAGFNILRKDPEAGTFKSIASYTTSEALKGLGTSSSGRSYAYTDANVEAGATYSYKIQGVSTDGTTKDISTLTGITVGIPTEFALYQNYPNPFNPSTTIRFDLKQASKVMLQIFNILGQRVETRNLGMMEAGRYNEVIDMSRHASGVYYYRVQAADFQDTKRMILIK